MAPIDKPDQAADTYLKLLRHSRLQQNEPMLISYLVNLSLRGISMDGINGLLHMMALAHLRKSSERS